MARTDKPKPQPTADESAGLADQPKDAHTADARAAGGPHDEHKHRHQQQPADEGAVAPAATATALAAAGPVNFDDFLSCAASLPPLFPRQRCSTEGHC